WRAAPSWLAGVPAEVHHGSAARAGLLLRIHRGPDRGADVCRHRSAGPPPSGAVRPPKPVLQALWSGPPGSSGSPAAAPPGQPLMTLIATLPDDQVLRAGGCGRAGR